MTTINEQISEAIIKMAEEDQKERSKETPDWDKIDAIDKKNNLEIKNIINEYGFIGIKDYGKDASYKAWLLIQHMPEEDIEFMKMYLSLMKESLDDIDKTNLALLTDRINVYEGKPQIYGTQTHSEDDNSDLVFHPIEDVSSVDEKREEVGLNSLKEYSKWMEETFKQKVVLPEDYNNLEKLDTETSVEYLERMRKMGFLFHGTGSPEEIDMFEPRKASDPETEWNADTAVYASSEPVWATIFAVHKGKEPWGTSVITGENGRIKSVTAKISEKYKDQLSIEKGFVYVLPSDSFERQSERSTQYKSLEEVKPIAKVEVKLQDYYDMGGKVEFVNT